MLAAVGLFHLAAALFLFRGMLKRSFLLFTYIAWAQLILFAVGFMAFGIFCGPAGALPQLFFAFVITVLSGFGKTRAAFDSDTPGYKRQYKVLARLFVFIIIVYGLYMAYFAMNYPYAFSPAGVTEDYRATALFAENKSGAGTTEIYGFNVMIPQGFSLSGVSHGDASDNLGAYDKALFANGSDQILLTTKNGILIEQLYSMTATFDVKNSYEYFTNYINDRYGIVWMTAKSFAQFEYCGFTADGWHGYIERGPLLSAGRYLAKSFNIWSDEPGAARLELSFFFKDGGPAPDLASKILSSLEISKTVPSFPDTMKNAVSKVNSGEFDAAMIFLANALSQNYKSADAHYYMARCHISRGAHGRKNCLMHIDEALKIDPAHKEALELRAKVKI